LVNRTLLFLENTLHGIARQFSAKHFSAAVSAQECFSGRTFQHRHGSAQVQDLINQILFEILGSIT
jgi:hypothetical protein